ncbi:hypothetical protein C8R47DRAFT_1216163 [Mycena vitilis]|nr:hypothetical protein C8R47DRAFT_1216163 [Mycena vitilis]
MYSDEFYDDIPGLESDDDDSDDEVPPLESVSDRDNQSTNDPAGSAGHFLSPAQRVLATIVRNREGFMLQAEEARCASQPHSWLSDGIGASLYPNLGMSLISCGAAPAAISYDRACVGSRCKAAAPSVLLDSCKAYVSGHPDSVHTGKLYRRSDWQKGEFTERVPCRPSQNQALTAPCRACPSPRINLPASFTDGERIETGWGVSIPLALLSRNVHSLRLAKL